MAGTSDEAGETPNTGPDPTVEESTTVTEPQVAATDASHSEQTPDPPETPSSPSLDGMTAAIDSLGGRVREFHVRAENYEQIIRQMQSRIEQLQNDQVQSLLKPVVRRFAGLHAQAAEAALRAREHGEKAEKDLDFFTDAIEETLGFIDIESVAAAPLAEFDPKSHHAARVVTTDDPELDKRVHRVLRQGFTHVEAERVFLPAQVSVYRYEPPQ